VDAFEQWATADENLKEIRGLLLRVVSEYEDLLGARVDDEAVQVLAQGRARALALAAMLPKAARCEALAWLAMKAERVRQLAAQLNSVDGDLRALQQTKRVAAEALAVARGDWFWEVPGGRGDRTQCNSEDCRRAERRIAALLEEIRPLENRREEIQSEFTQIAQEIRERIGVVINMRPGVYLKKLGSGEWRKSAVKSLVDAAQVWGNEQVKKIGG
jgi:hypothetical protein